MEQLPLRVWTHSHSLTSVGRLWAGPEVQAFSAPPHALVPHVVAQCVAAHLFAVKTQAFVEGAVVTATEAYYGLAGVDEGVGEELDGALMGAFNGLGNTYNECLCVNDCVHCPVK